jgi:putative DNA primase/helicase
VLRDVDDVDIGRQIAEWYRLDYSSAAVHEQLSSVANESRWHPVRAYLDALPDPTSTLIDEWLGDAFGCVRTPMTAAIGRAWLVSMVARAMQPGCKVDTVPVLVGIQGAGKSSTLRALMPDPGWYADSEIPLRSSGPDRYQVLRGVWLYEVAELDRYSSKIDASEIKAYLTSQADTYRASYGRRVRTVPRQVVFAGSTNSHEPLVDPTGARRFWPLACGQCDPEWVETHRDLLWAEAMAIYRRGDSWWLSTEAAAEVAEVADGYRAGDPWEHSIALWLAMPAQSLDRYLTISQVLSGAVELPVPQHDQHTQRRAGAVLTRLGWHKTERKSGSDGRSGSRMWERPI